MSRSIKLLLATSTLIFIGAGCSKTTITNSLSSLPETPTQPSTMIPETQKSYSAVLHTDLGDITIDLSDETPITSKNFVDLAKKNFYDNTIFHRTIKGFMIQGGDPRGDGTGDPGYRFADEPFTGGYTRGTVAMANSGPNTNGSQFFIMHDDYPLQPNYVIFGHVTKGIETVDKIATAEVTMSPSGEPSKPVKPVHVKSVDVTENNGMEILDVVNDDDVVIGSATREQIYKDKLLHRIVHVMVFNEKGELALQLRGPDVSYLPLHWSTSVGGHVDSGESYESAGLREMQEELGIQTPLFSFIKYQFEKDSTNHKKFLGVFHAKYDGHMNFGKREVADVVWKSLDEVEQMIASGEKFHPELLFILKNL